MTTIAYVGNFQHRHCTEVHVAATFEALGHEVIRLQEGPPDTEHAVPLAAIENVARRADLLLYTRTWGFTDREAAIAMFRRLEEAGVPTASFHLDLYLGLNRENTLDGDPFWETGWVFTPDGDPASEAVFAARGIRHVWSPPAVYKPECVNGTARTRWPDGTAPGEIVFVGSYPYPHPEWPYRDRLVQWLTATYGRRFRRYGANATTIRNEPLNDLYASAAVVVGDSLCPGFTKPRYWSDRITETLGRGGVLVWPRISGVESCGFREDEHYLGYDFDNFDELRARVDWAVENRDEARAMAARGQAFVREHHTYENRLRWLLAEVLGPA